MVKVSRASLFVLCFLAFLDWMSYGLVFPIFSAMLFAKEPIFLAATLKAMPGFWFGVLLAMSPLAQFFSAPVMGSLSDQYGRKILLQITALTIVFGYLLSAWAIGMHSFSLLMISRVITGIGASNIAIISSAIADISQPTVKAKNFGMIAMANGLGFTLGPFIGGKLSYWGFFIPFLGAAMLTLVNFFLLVFLFKETHQEGERSCENLKQRLSRLRKNFLQRKFRLFFLAFCVFCFGWSFYWEFIPATWIRKYHLNASMIGNFYAFGSLVFVLSSGFFIKPIVNRFKPLFILIVAWILLACFLFPLLYAPLAYYWGGILVQQFLIALIFPTGTAFISNIVGRERQGEALGAFLSMQSFAFAITPFFGGIFLDFSVNVPLIISSFAMIVACCVLFLYIKKEIILR